MSNNVKRYRLEITNTMSFYDVDNNGDIIQTNGGAQACYNVPADFVHDCIEHGYLIEDKNIVTKRNGTDGFPLRNSNCSFVLGSGLTWLIFDDYRSPSFIVYRSGTNGKYIMYKTAYAELAKNSPEEFGWFNSLYNKNLASNIVEFVIDFDNNVILLEVRFSALKSIGNNLYTNSIVDENNRVKGGHNTILYGVPGSGKSWTINNEYCNDDKAEIERLVFHPDYTYADFVGQILPDVDGDLVKYVFTAGPFTNMLKKAYENPEKRHILIIEEINRGNAPAIFGDIFQLLDRDDDGNGIFEVTNTNIAEKVYGDENRRIKMPSNLTILATMNTSDQNVFTLDTAFQRRWNMRLIDNDFDKVDNDLANAPILDTGITWRTFCETINDIIIDSTAKTSSSEDKRLGVYFIKKQDIELPDNFADFDLDKYKALLNEKKNNSEYVLKNNEDFKKYSEILLKVRKFPEKVLKYLWDDVFKYDKSPLFEETKFKSLEDVIKHFILTKGIDRFAIFKEGIVNKLANNRNV